VKVLGEIPAPDARELRTGSLRRRDLEAYRGLLGKLDGARSVLTIGSGPGRRRTATGLAAAAAAGGTRTALLECDLSDPCLADELGLANAPGLHEYLSGAAAVDSVLQPMVPAGPGSAAARDPLVVVVAGRPASDAWALLSSERFRNAVEGLRAAYDLVAIAGPAVRDAYAVRELPGVAEATLLCVARGERAGKPPIRVTGRVIVD
jgi:Mrp family chromosome partitioning ATPase